MTKKTGLKLWLVMIVVLVAALMMAAVPVQIVPGTEEVAVDQPIIVQMADVEAEVGAVEQVFAFLNEIGLDWSTVGLSGVIIGLVYLAGISGLAKSGNAKRLAGGLAALSIAAVRVQFLDIIPPDDSGIGLIMVNGGVEWLIAALGHASIEVAQAGLKARKAAGG